MRLFGAFVMLLFCVACNTNDSCYEEPNPDQFQSIAGHWDYVGFADDFANQPECFDTTGAVADTNEFSFTSDGMHYQGHANGSSSILTYSFSTDKSELYIFMFNITRTNDTIAKARIGKLTEDELMFTYLPRRSGEKFRSEYYRRIKP